MSSTLAGHIPGAVYASLNDDLSGAAHRDQRPASAAVRTTRWSPRCSGSGIANGTQVVVYDQDCGTLRQPPVVAAALRSDTTAVALLDGGFAKWTAEGRPVQAGEETRAATVVPAVASTSRCT